MPMKRVHGRSPLGQLDLNLLRVFVVVHREGSLSRAGETLALTQSAVSHAVARLRQHLDDPLFVREGARMVPTPLAQRVASSIADALASVERALAGGRAFDPSVDMVQLTLAIPDEIEPAVLPPLRALLTMTAPGVVLAGVRFDLDRLRADLASRAIDVAVGVLHPGATAASTATRTSRTATSPSPCAATRPPSKRTCSRRRRRTVAWWCAASATRPRCASSPRATCC